MKGTILLLFVAAFGSACGSQPTAENKTAAVANKNASSNSMNSVSNLDKSAGPQLAGEKITTPLTVEFGQEGFPAGRQWIDPDSKISPTPYETKNGVLKFDIITTKDLYGENRTAPRLLKAVDGDFQIETRVKFDPRQDYQGAGLLIFKDAANYLRFERAFGGVGGGMSGLRLDARKTDEYKTIVTPDDVKTEAQEVDMKILRAGKTFTAFWRPDENGEWREVGEFVSDYPDTVQIGLIGCNTAGPISAEFGFIKLAPAN